MNFRFLISYKELLVDYKEKSFSNTLKRFPERLNSESLIGERPARLAAYKSNIKTFRF